MLVSGPDGRARSEESDMSQYLVLIAGSGAVAGRSRRTKQALALTANDVERAFLLGRLSALG